MILIKNVTILTMNEQRDVIDKGMVWIKGDQIERIGRMEEASVYEQLEGVEIIDGQEGILMPGMVNCHTHASMIPFRSLADDHPNILKDYIFPLEKNLVDRTFTYKAARYGLGEMLLGGVTTFCDMYYFEDEVAKAAKDLHIRGVLGETIIGFPSPDSEEAYGGIAYAENFIKEWQDDELVIPAVAPHAPYTNTDESLKEAYELSKKYNVPFVMHVAEERSEWEKYTNEYGVTPVGYLESLGVLDDNFIAAHSLLINEEDIEILARRGVKVSHNIGANTKGGKAVMPLLKLQEEGVKVGLGTDGPMSGNRLDILEQMTTVGRVHKLTQKDRTSTPVADIVALGTIEGAKVLGLDQKIGSIEAGKKADLVLIETESINMQPAYNPYAAIVYSAHAGNVHTVMVGGRVVVRDKKLLTADIKELRANMKDISERVKEVVEI
ncbi:MAG: amidohydrolase [Cellulosilyticaceae bacterium]